MKFRPCIDIHDNKVKQIVGSTLRDGEAPVTNFETDRPPSYFASLYRTDNLPGGHVIMLGKGNEAAAIEAVSTFPGGLQAGGGINPQNGARFLDAGASHVIVTSYVFRDGVLHWDRLEEMVHAVGRERLVLDLSCTFKAGRYVVVTDRWQYETSEVLSEQLFEKLAGYCDEFLVHGAHVEGMRRGIDAKLVALLGRCAICSQRAVTYAGGVRSLEDLDAAKLAGEGCVDVTIGSALDLFGGTLAYREVVAWFAKNGKKTIPTSD